MEKKAMKKRGRKSILKTPSPLSSPAESSPKSPIFTRTASTSKGVKRVAAALTTTTSPPRTTHKAPTNISDLKSLASSSIDELKRRIDRSHSEILKDLEASHSRLHKRFKMQSQGCQQAMDEAEKDYKKLSERITESREAMKASYEEFMVEAQATAARACKTSIAELSQKYEKTIDSLRDRHGISSN
ncbi:unnamed protein product [Trifolium pratense]|uniref:Uncharacterized protein n=1 Tax=Trifolium pratense TaxID=57577 RepID=A0ACB0JSY9_TRIPR|nr:unnamed protein product [Trifolium pratense]